MTDAEIAATPPLSRPDPVLDRAMQLLLVGSAPVAVPDLARDLGRDPGEVAAAVRSFEEVGRLRRDGHGAITAAAGLGVVPDDYELRASGRRWWAWCAKTGLGVLAALAAGGSLRGRSPDTGEPLRVDFDGAEPRPTACAVLWPHERLQNSCSSAGELCAAYTLFADADGAAAWAVARSVDAEVVTVAEAVRRALPRYRHSLGPSVRLVTGVAGD